MTMIIPAPCALQEPLQPQSRNTDCNLAEPTITVSSSTARAFFGLDRPMGNRARQRSMLARKVVRGRGVTMPGGRRAGWSAAAPRGAAQHLQSTCRMHGPSSASVGAPQGMQPEPKQAATLASCNEICGLRWMGLWICLGKRTDVNKVREVCKSDLRSPRLLRE